jgi:hypothetical protein
MQRNPTVARTPLTFTDLPPSPMRQWLMETEAGQPAHSEARFTTRSFFTVRQAQDAMFERCGDKVLDMLSWNLWR